MADNNHSRDPKELQREAAERGAPSKGMTSPDSTQVPLRADTGEPDEDALGGRDASGGSDRMDQSRSGGSSSSGSMGGSHR